MRRNYALFLCRKGRWVNEWVGGRKRVKRVFWWWDGTGTLMVGIVILYIYKGAGLPTKIYIIY